jgi:putative tryptophan/tyrosine transport system permease protein
MITLPTIITILEMGFIYSLVVISVWLTSTVIKFYDLSVEGSFCLGGAVTATLLLAGLPAPLLLPCSLLAGALVGCITGLLHTHLKMNDLLSGIVVTTALFSINLIIATANKALGSSSTLFSYFPSVPGLGSSCIPLALLVVLVIGILKWFFTTEIGFLIRVVGSNPKLLADLGKNKSWYIIGTLMISNALTYLAGSLFVQYVGFFSIWSGVGILVIALTGLMIAQLFGHGIGLHLILGAIIYQLLITLTFEFNIPQEWNKLITAFFMVIFMQIARKETHA